MQQTVLKRLRYSHERAVIMAHNVTLGLFFTTKSHFHANSVAFQAECTCTIQPLS